MSATPTPNTLTFRVDGMTCEHCCRAIDAQLRDVPGVTRVDVDLDAGTVAIDGAHLAEQVLQDAIMHAGYSSFVA